MRYLIAALCVFCSAHAGQAAIVSIGPNGIPVATPFTSISSAVAATGSKKVTLQLTTDYSVNTLTVPSNITLKPVNGAVVTINTGKTLTLAAHPDLPKDRRAFAGTGTVSGLKSARPEWWGGVGDASSTAYTGTESAAALQSAIDSAIVSGSAVDLSGGLFKVSTALSVVKSVKMVGAGQKTGILNLTATGSAAIIVDGSASAYPYANYSVFEDFAIYGNITTSGSGIKYMDRAAFVQFNRLFLSGNNHGIWHNAPPNSGGTARATWGSSYGATFNSVYTKANYGKGFYDDSTDNPDPGAQFNNCIAEQNVVGIDWGSGEVIVTGGVYQANTTGGIIFRKRGVADKVYFEEGVADYGGVALLSLNGYGSAATKCIFAMNGTANIKGISYTATSVIEGNLFSASGSPAGNIGIYNAVALKAYSGSRVYKNLNNGATTFLDIGTAEIFYDDSSGVTHMAGLETTSTITSAGKLTVGVAATGATNQITFVGQASTANAANNSIFIDSATGKLTFRNGSGVSTALY